MIIVGIPPCKACKQLAARYPHIAYVEVPSIASAYDKQALEVKKALTRLKVNWFPVILNDEMTEILPVTALEFGDV